MKPLILNPSQDIDTPMRLPQGTQILSELSPLQGGLDQVLRLLSAGAFSGYLQLTDGRCAGSVILGAGRPIYARWSGGREQVCEGVHAASRLAQRADGMRLRVVQLDKKRFDYARIIAQAEAAGRGLSPVCDELTLFYSRLVRGNRSGLIQMYNERSEYYIHINRGQIVDKPSSLDEAFDRFRSARDYLIDVYNYRPERLIFQELKVAHFDPGRLKKLFIEQLNEEFGYRAKALVDEIQAGTVGLHNAEDWLERIEKFLRQFICSRPAARNFTAGLARGLPEDE